MLNKLPGNITITNQSSRLTVIEIEGIIGIPEQWQFDEPGDRVATYEKFRESLAGLQAVTNPEIIVNIRSTGGSVNDALLIYDALVGLKSRITTRCYGYVASAATIIAQAASKKCREISANSLYLIHRSACNIEGNADELVQILELLNKTDERIANIYAYRSGKAAKVFKELMNQNNGNGRWLSADEVIELGLADKKTGKEAEVESYNTGVLSNFGRRDQNGYPRSFNKIKERVSALFTSRKTESEEHLKSHNDMSATETVAGELFPEIDLKCIMDGEGHTAILEIRDARQSARPTSTLPKEDPSPHDRRISHNASAYEMDARNIL